MLNLGIILMFCTGVRVGELVALKWEDIVDNTIKIRRTEVSYKNDEGNIVYEIREYPKTEAGIRTVIIPMEFINILKKLKGLSGDKEYVFQNNGRLTKTLMVRKRLYLVCAKTGIKKKSPHKLRKTYASILLDNGLDKNMIEGLLGHTQIGTSEKYYHRNRKTDEKNL